MLSNGKEVTKICDKRRQFARVQRRWWLLCVLGLCLLGIGLSWWPGAENNRGFTLASARADEGAELGRQRVLVLYSSADSMPWVREVRATLYRHLDTLPAAGRVELYEERLDGYRLGSAEESRHLAGLLQARYSAASFDLVISEGAPAAGFVGQNPDLFGEALHVVVDLDGRYTAAGNVLSADKIQAALFRNVVTILSLRPDTRELVVVGNLMPETLAAIEHHWRGHYSGHLRLQVWDDDFTFEELYRRAERLPDDAVVLYELVGFDRNGSLKTPYRVAEELAAVAPVPVFARHSSLLGSGVVGGYMVSGELTGAVIAELASGRSQQAYSANDFYRNEFDQRQLQRWEIDLGRLPQDSVLRFAPPQPDYYRWALWLLLAASAVGWSLLGWVVWIKRRLQREVEQRRESEGFARHLANHDALTGLPSLRLCKDRLAHAITVARRERNRVAVIFIDLNDFKVVNDTHGHDAGDELLRILALRFRAALREVDTIARIGGDEFLLILPGIHEPADAVAVGRKIVAVAEQPVRWGEYRLTVGASVGIAYYPDDGSKVLDLINVADKGMYSDKRKRKQADPGRRKRSERKLHTS